MAIHDAFGGMRRDLEDHMGRRRNDAKRRSHAEKHESLSAVHQGHACFRISGTGGGPLGRDLVDAPEILWL